MNILDIYLDQNCVFGFINGTLSSNLSVHCNDGYCVGLTVWCPINGDNCNIDCDINNSCDEITIIGNSVDLLSVNCQGCPHSFIELSTKSNSISCDGSLSNGCYNSTVYGNIINNGVWLTCNGLNSCYDMFIKIQYTTEMHIICETHAACYFRNFTAGNSTPLMDDFSLSCNNSSSCVYKYANDTHVSIPNTIYSKNIKIICNGLYINIFSLRLYNLHKYKKEKIPVSIWDLLDLLGQHPIQSDILVTILSLYVKEVVHVTILP